MHMSSFRLSPVFSAPNAHLSVDWCLTQVNGRIALSTKTLEPEPGDMIKNPQKVYDMAEVRCTLETR